jgi:endoglucanase
MTQSARLRTLAARGVRCHRHVLLAEPLVDDFARCFQGVGSDEAPRLADSFRFVACLKRERLVDILRSAATA